MMAAMQVLEPSSSSTSNTANSTSNKTTTTSTSTPSSSSKAVSPSSLSGEKRTRSAVKGDDKHPATGEALTEKQKQQKDAPSSSAGNVVEPTPSTNRRVAARTIAEDSPSSSPSSSNNHTPALATLILTDLRSKDEATLVRGMNELMRALQYKDTNRMDTQRHFFLLGGHFAVVSAMKEHVANKALQEAGLFVLANAARGNVDLKDAISMVEGMQVILNAMKCHAQEENVHTYGIVALSNLISQHHSNAHALVHDHQDAIVFIGDTIKSFVGKSAQVVKSACLLLKNLCDYKDLRPAILRSKASTALMIAFDEHYQDGDALVRQRAQKAIRLLMEQDV